MECRVKQVEWSSGVAKWSGQVEWSNGVAK